MSERMPTNLGAWAKDDFENTVRTTLAVGVDSDLSSDVRFIAGVAKLIQRRIAQADDKEDSPKPAVFLLEPRARALGSDMIPKRVPMLNSGLEPIGGRLWFVSPVVVMGSFVELDDIDDDELFRIVTEELRLGNVPAAIFDPRTKALEIRFYRNGLGDPEECDVSSAHSRDVTVEEIFEKIDHIYGRGLITPDSQLREGKLWEDGSKYYPKKNAEYLVQLHLWTGLTSAFPTCTIRPEQPDVSGRLDLEIEESDPIDRSKFVRYAILELKVLRTYGSTGREVSEEYTLGWVKSGVKQAASYRDLRGATAAALCCFDMRRENTGAKCFTHVVELAAGNKVELRNWFLYSTAAQYRDATVELPEK